MPFATSCTCARIQFIVGVDDDGAPGLGRGAIEFDEILEAVLETCPGTFREYIALYNPPSDQ
jgi:hypothetical protein